MTGECNLIFGPMFSCKTTELLRRLTRTVDAGFSGKILYINHSLDERTDVKNLSTDLTEFCVSTHNSLINRLPKNLDCIKTNNLSSINIEKYSIIGVDEGHFFNDIIIVRDWVLKYNKIVHVVSLSGDFNLNIFGKVYELIPIAKSVLLLNSICNKCLKNNITTDAITSHKLEKSDKIIDIGGKNSYIPLCLDCYNKFNNN